MTGRAAETAAVTALAVAVTLAIAAPVVLSPSGRVFGMATVGHHHDPFTFMRQIDQPIETGIYLQPATDVPGALAARAVGPVAAYNSLVLVTFPLSALAAFLLARHLAISPVWAALAALAFAFSPFHLSHAAYHPHIAQTQWIPLYFLALWRCLDNPTRGAVALLAVVVGGVTLSNFYGGLIAAVITPVALGGYWFFASRPAHRPLRRLLITTAALVIIAAAGVIYAASAAGDLAVNPDAYRATSDDLLRYGARWWSYGVPPVEHPAVGAFVRRLWSSAGVDVGLLEQQVSLGWGVIALAVVAIAGWLRGDQRPVFLARVPILAIVGTAAFVCSLAAGLPPVIHDLMPMFRSYARFGVVVQLMTALLAAVGAQRLWESGVAHARMACTVLIALGAAEYAVWPPSMSRDVLPTQAHRWVAAQPNRLRVLDCTPPDAESADVQWLTQYRISSAAEPFADCGEPNFPEKLAVAGYTHLIVRGGSGESRPFTSRRVPPGLQRAAHFADSELYAVAALVPAVHTVSMTGFHPREHDATWTWRWMEGEASWTISNRRGHAVIANLDVEMMAFGRPLELTVLLDGVETHALMIDESRSLRRIASLLLTPGDHALTFRPVRPPAVHAGFTGEEQRPLSFRVGTWRWTIEEIKP